MICISYDIGVGCISIWCEIIILRQVRNISFTYMYMSVNVPKTECVIGLRLAHLALVASTGLAELPGSLDAGDLVLTVAVGRHR